MPRDTDSYLGNSRIPNEYILQNSLRRSSTIHHLREKKQLTCKFDTRAAPLALSTMSATDRFLRQNDGFKVGALFLRRVGEVHDDVVAELAVDVFEGETFCLRSEPLSASH